MGNSDRKPGLIKRLWKWWRTPSRLALGTLLLIGFVGGIVFWGGFNTGMEKANTEEFCISCHEMRNTVYQEYMDSVHYNNRSGVRATCPDCHVPHEFVPKMIRKLKASKELYGKIFGVIDTPQKFEAHRLTMAQNEWRRMKDNNSQECRNCHNFEYMDTTAQKSVAAKMHDQAVKDGQTCIDCHKGIVHFLPEVHGDQNAQKSSEAKGGAISDGSTIFATEMVKATNDKGNEVRLMPYAELMQWKVNGDQVQGTLHGWQQVGAEAVVYQELGKRITLALLDEDARNHVQVVKTVHDAVTDSDWKEINVVVNVAKEKMSSDLTALNQYGNQLNQTQCSGCHAAIGADHYTANQWIGVVNSMKDRTSMNKDEVRALTIYLQRNAKDMAKQ